MKKKLACMLLMGTLALSMAACGNGQDKNTGAATENSVESTEGAAESTGTSVESTEAGNAGQTRWVMITGRIPRSRRKC